MKSFLTGLLVGAMTVGAAAQSWDLPAEIRALRDAIEKLSASLSRDAMTGETVPKSGPLLHLMGPDGIAVPVRGTSDGLLRVEIHTPESQ